MAFEDFYPWIILLNNFVTITCCSCSAILSFLLIILHHRNRSLVPYSPVMNLYLICNVLTGVVTSFATVYLLIFWRPINAIYNAQILFILGGISVQSLTYVPLIESFLCIDRCLVIMIPTKYSSTFKYLMAVFAAVLYFAVASAYNYATNVFQSYPTFIETKCMVFLCQKDRQSQLITVLLKSSVAVINVLGTIVLGCLMENRITTAKAIKRINQVVFHMLISTIIFVFMPNIAAFMAHMYYFKLTDYTGPYGATLTSVNMAICSIIYWRMFKKSMISPHVTLKNNTTSRVPSVVW